MTDRIPSPDEIMESDSTRLVLERIRLTCAEEFTTEAWYGMVQSLGVDAWADQRAFAIALRASTHILGLADQRRRIHWPATWQDHLRKDFLHWLASKGWVTEADRDDPPTGWRRTFWQWVYKHVHHRLRAVKYTTEEVQVYKSACPHIDAATSQHGTHFCIAYLTRLDQRGYRKSDYLVSKARALLVAALEAERDLYGGHSLRVMDAARHAVDMLEETLEAMGKEARE